MLRDAAAFATQRLPEQRWRLHALACTLGCAAAGLIVLGRPAARLPGLTLALIATLQLENRGKIAYFVSVAYHC